MVEVDLRSGMRCCCIKKHFKQRNPKDGDICLSRLLVPALFGNTQIILWGIPTFGPCGLSGANPTLPDSGVSLWIQAWSVSTLYPQQP
jgi:hypothetical protein